MRQAGTIPDARQAELFANYLLSLGIHGRVESTDARSIVWVLDDRHWQQSREELASFLADPDAERYRQAQASAEAIRRQQRNREQRYLRNVIDVRRRWQSWTEGRFPLTWLLIGVSVLFSLATNFGHSDWSYRWLYMVPMEKTGEGLQVIWHGQFWRLITPALINVGGWWHLLFNMYWTYQFAALIETRRGTLRLLGVVLTTAICSNLAQYAYMITYEDKLPLFGGMSGVGFGMFGFVWMKSRFDPGTGIFIDRNLVGTFLIWLVLCYTGLLEKLFGIAVANTAHTVGMLSGMALGYAPVLWRRIVNGLSD